MRILGLNIYIIIVLISTNCSTKYALEKSNVCLNPNNQTFTTEEMSSIEKALKNTLGSSKYTLKNQGDQLELKVKAKRNEALEELINRPAFIIKKLEDKTNSRREKALKRLKDFENFKQVNSLDGLRYQSSILGYVDSEKELLNIKQTLADQHYFLSKDGFYWTHNPVSISKKERNRHYLIATNEDEEMNFEFLPNLVDGIQAGYDGDTFEPCITVTLNECGVAEMKNFLSNKEKVFIATIINDELILGHHVRIMRKNVILIRGFKSFEDTKARAAIVKSRGVQIKVK